MSPRGFWLDSFVGCSLGMHRRGQGSSLFMGPLPIDCKDHTLKIHL